MEKKENSAIDEIWFKYKEEKSRDIKDKLVLNYAPLVKYVAGRVSMGLPRNIEKADLISYGMFGLIDAIEKFDPTKNIKFETYAISRIRGAMIDELRSIDWVPRSVRRKEKQLEKIYIDLENKFKRMPTDEEVAEEMGFSVKDLHDTYTQLSYTSQIALEEFWHIDGTKDDQVNLINTLKDTKSNDPLKVLELEELKQVLTKVIEGLPKREKTIIALYYYEGLTLKEIGEVMRVTESRISQIHTKTIIRLKAHLKDTLPLLHQDE
ncbi:RNA polymerase sigma factor WhiG [Candidatus Oleimmundimicrobium sp.]|uniref:RNA polymerase sigma factor WhiG n=1 Tax=Candidatus Oleimmundimicrobium sp. TaxID=3060597 RepID=UPI00271C8BDF|nr:RNA polymerase sigma factor WhiG [Candidatus Oleimmundimicrobium sp.]MDO8885372.1 RNA polymerase sigma factor WhiG [Candidatus Oleimmundimicrobium sp.]